MSKTTETALWLLLKLNAGLLDPFRAEQIRQKIETDPRWRTRWLRLREFSFDSEDSLDRGLVVDVDPQVIGEFVEQRLSAETARKLETMAWKHPQLLREIAIAFQWVHLPAPSAQLDSSDSSTLPQRIVQSLGPGAVNGQARNASPVRLAAAESGNNANFKTTIASAWRQRSAWLLAISASLLLLAAIVLVVNGYGSGRFDNRLVEQSVDARSQLDGNDGAPVGQRDQSQELVLPQTAADNDVEKEWVDELPTDGLAEVELDQDHPEVIPVDGVPQETLIVESDDTPADVENLVGQNVPAESVESPKYIPIHPEWKRYHGVIGLRQPGNDIIHGYGYVDQLSPEMEIQVLPMSWAVAEVPYLGQLVVDGDSSFRIGKRHSNLDGHQQDQQVEINIRFGRLAVVDTVRGTRLLLTTGESVWPLTVLEDHSTVVVEYVAEQARLYVRRGALRVGDHDLATNQHLVWKQGTLGHPQRDNLNTKWVDRPQYDLRIPDQVRQRLYNSQNLVTVLGQLQHSKNEATRIAAMRWQWTLHPAVVVNIFRRHDMAHWLEAMNWLVGQSPEQPRTRAIWRALAESPGNPEVALEFMRWVGFRANHQLPTPVQLKRMVSFLTHERLFVRFVATYLLENSFGNPPGFRPQAPEHVRLRALQLWRQHIAEVYQRKVATALNN